MLGLRNIFSKISIYALGIMASTVDMQAFLDSFNSRIDLLAQLQIAFQQSNDLMSQLQQSSKQLDNNIASLVSTVGDTTQVTSVLQQVEDKNTQMQALTQKLTGLNLK